MITDIISLLKNENVSKDSLYMGKYVAENLTNWGAIFWSAVQLFKKEIILKFKFLFEAFPFYSVGSEHLQS